MFRLLIVTKLGLVITTLTMLLPLQDLSKYLIFTVVIPFLILNIRGKYSFSDYIPDPLDERLVPVRIIVFSWASIYVPLGIIVNSAVGQTSGNVRVLLWFSLIYLILVMSFEIIKFNDFVDYFTGERWSILEKKL